MTFIGCASGPNIRSVMTPNAAKLVETERSWILKAYKGMTMAVDGMPDADDANFVTYGVAPGEHELDITVFHLIDETGFEYHGDPVHWKGTVTIKPALYYEVSAEPNTAKNSIDIRFTSHVRPFVNYEEDRVLNHAAH